MQLLLLRLLRKLTILKRIKTSSRLQLNDSKFTIPIINEIGMHNLMMDEFWMLDIFKRLSPNDDDVLIDIGANVGQTLLKWKAVNANAHYIGIEPLPRCTEYLRSLIEANNLKSCKIIDKAVSNQAGKNQLHIHFEEESDRTASLISQEFTAIKKIEIQTIDFPTLLKTLDVSPKKIKCIKIDIEGGELEVLESMQTFLSDHKAIIILEVFSINPHRLKKLNAILATLPYRSFRIIKHKLNFKSIKLIEQIEENIAIEESDYILIPKELNVNLETT